MQKFEELKPELRRAICRVVVSICKLSGRKATWHDIDYFTKKVQE